MKLAILYSGGKDSTYSIQKLLESGYKVVCLITMISENDSSYMLHTSNIEMTKLSSEALGIPLYTGRTRGLKEIELRDIKEAIVAARNEYCFAGLATGAIASFYQKERIESIARECGLSCFAPLWGTDQERYLRLLIANSYDFIITSVSAKGLDDEWLGKKIDDESVEALIELSRNNKFNAAFEGGEAETVVLDCPIFRKKLLVLESTTDWNGYSGVLRIKRAVLEEKRNHSNAF